MGRAWRHARCPVLNACIEHCIAVLHSLQLHLLDRVRILLQLPHHCFGLHRSLLLFTPPLPQQLLESNAVGSRSRPTFSSVRGFSHHVG